MMRKRAVERVTEQDGYVNSAMLAIVNNRRELVGALQRDDHKAVLVHHRAVQDGVSDLTTYLSRMQQPAVAQYMQASNGDKNAKAK